MTEYHNYYNGLKKPRFSPPAWIFWPVWGILYILIFLSFWKVFLMYLNWEIPFIVIIPFILNLIFNFIFTPIHFWLKNNIFALIDVILVLITLVFATIFIFPYSANISYLQIPYLLWVSFATVLQISITYLNIVNKNVDK